MTQVVSTAERTAFANPEADEVAGVRKTEGEPAAPSVTFLELPAPPSVNALYRNVPGKGRVDTPLYRDWKGHAGWRLREQRPTPVHGRVLIVANLERTSDLADVDNRLKATLDLLVKHQVIDDDRFVSGLAVAWSPARNALMQLAIMPVANLSVHFQLAPNGREGGWHFPAPQSEQEPC